MISDDRLCNSSAVIDHSASDHDRRDVIFASVFFFFLFSPPSLYLVTNCLWKIPRLANRIICFNSSSGLSLSFLVFCDTTTTMDGDSYAVRSECEHSDTTDMIICLCKGGWRRTSLFGQSTRWTYYCTRNVVTYYNYTITAACSTISLRRFSHGRRSETISMMKSGEWKRVSEDRSRMKWCIDMYTQPWTNKKKIFEDQKKRRTVDEKRERTCDL